MHALLMHRDLFLRTNDELYHRALEVADPGMDKANLFREAMKVFVRVRSPGTETVVIPSRSQMTVADGVPQADPCLGRRRVNARLILKRPPAAACARGASLRGRPGRARVDGDSLIPSHHRIVTTTFPLARPVST
jgi:hypothetical protein